MTKTILKTILGGILVGALAFFVPRLVVGLFIIMLIARLFCGCRSRHCCGGHYRGGRFEMIDKVRAMTDAEYAEFKNNHEHGCCHSGKKSECKTPTSESTK
jgi:hypothetical protein